MTEDTSTAYEPEFILDPAQYDDGFIWIPNWEEYQHTDVIKAGVSMRWHRCLTKTLDNRRYRALPMGQRGLYHGLLMLSSRVGQGRVDAQVSALRGQLGDPSKHLRGSRDALIHTGLVAIVSRSAPEGFMMGSRTEEKRIEKKERSARESGSPNGAAPHAQKREPPEGFRLPIPPNIVKAMEDA